jgi:pyruvate kinase
MAAIADGIFIDVDALRARDLTMQLAKIQNDLSEAARLHGKPLVVGGRLLEGSVRSTEPLAGEMASIFESVSNHAYDGVLLTTEAKRPAHGVRALELLGDIVEEAEADGEAALALETLPGANGNR